MFDWAVFGQGRARSGSSTLRPFDPEPLSPSPPSPHHLGPLIPFLQGLGSLVRPLKPKRGTLYLFQATLGSSRRALK